MSPTLDEVSLVFKHWRSGRVKRTNVPADLVRQAVALVGHHSKTEISRRLGITYSMLNRWLQRSSNTKFIELSQSPHQDAPPAPLSVQWHLPNGSQITINGAPEQTAWLLETLIKRSE